MSNRKALITHSPPQHPHQIMENQIQQIVSDFELYSPLLNIRTKEGDIIPFRFNSVQWRYHLFKKQLKLEKKPLRIVILKYRQGGFTTYEQAESFWITATHPNQRIMTITHKEEASIEIFKMVLLFYDTIDELFKPSRNRTSSRNLDFYQLRSNFYIGTAGSENIGITLSKAHCSEFAYWPNDPLSQLSKLQDAVPMSGQIVIESTPNGYNSFEELYTGAKEGKNAYSPFFIRWFDDLQYQMVLDPGEDLEPYSTEEQSLVENYHITPEQIKWRRWKIAEKSGKIEDFWEKYPEDDVNCFMSTGRSFFDVRKIMQEAMPFANSHPPIKTDSGKGVKIWEEPDPSLEYVAGADPAEGVSKDNSSYTLRERRTGRLILTMANEDMKPDEFAYWIAKFGRVYNNAYTVVERNNHGHTVLNELIKYQDYGDPSILYYHKDPTEDLKPIKYRVRREKNKAHLPGFPSKSNTKYLLLDDYRKFVEQNPCACLDTDQLGELKVFKRHPDGSLGSESGKKDDRVISDALCIHGMLTARPPDTLADNFEEFI